MSKGKLFKMIPRAPRYVIRFTEDQFIRFVRFDEEEEGQVEDSYDSTLLDISSTGLSFLTHKNSSIQVGEKIKIEFPIPGFRRAAWWAKVVRIQKCHSREESFDLFEGFMKDSVNEIQVGVHFCDMSLSHKEMIAREIEKKIVEFKRKKKRIFFKKIIKRLNKRFLKIFLVGIFVLIVIYFLVFHTPFKEFYLSLKDDLLSFK